MTRAPAGRGQSAWGPLVPRVSCAPSVHRTYRRPPKAAVERDRTTDRCARTTDARGQYLFGRGTAGDNRASRVNASNMGYLWSKPSTYTVPVVNGQPGTGPLTTAALIVPNSQRRTFMSRAGTDDSALKSGRAQPSPCHPVTLTR